MISAILALIATASIFFFVAVLVPVFLLGAGFNLFVSPVLHLPTIDFWQALGLFLLFLGVRFVMMPTSSKS